MNPEQNFSWQCLCNIFGMFIITVLYKSTHLLYIHTLPTVSWHEGILIDYCHFESLGCMLQLLCPDSNCFAVQLVHMPPWSDGGEPIQVRLPERSHNSTFLAGTVRFDMHLGQRLAQNPNAMVHLKCGWSQLGPKLQWRTNLTCGW